MPKFYLNLGYKLKKKALCYSHLNNTVDILDRNIVMDYFRHENHWQSSQKKKNNNGFKMSFNRIASYSSKRKIFSCIYPITEIRTNSSQNS